MASPPRATGSTMRFASGCAAARRRSGSASASSLRSSARRRTAASRGSAILPGRAVRLRNGRVPRIGWATVEPGRRGVLLRSLVRRRDAGRHGQLRGRRRRGAARQLPRRSVPSREERGAPERDTWSDASPAPDPVSRRRRRPRRQGRALRGPARRRRPGRARCRVLRRRCRRARLPRRQGDLEERQCAGRARPLESPSAWRSRSRSAAGSAPWPMRRRCSTRARTRSPSTPPRSPGRRSSASWPSGSARRRS